MIAQLRFLGWFARRYQTAVRRGIYRLITNVSTVGIAMGVAALTIGLSAINGFEAALQQRILALVPHGEVVAASGTLTAWPEVAKRLITLPGIVAAAPYVESAALVEKGTTFKAIQLRGISMAHEGKITTLPQRIVPATAWSSFSGTTPQIILGQGIASALAVTPGGWITLVLPAHLSAPTWQAPKRLWVKVVGVFAAGSQLDQSLALVPLELLQRHLGMGAEVTGIALKVAQPFNAAATLQQAARRYYGVAPRLHFQSWLAHYGHLYRDIQLVRGMIKLAVLLIMGLACFNITATLMLTAKQRQGDIAILATLGASRRLVSGLFLCYGLLTGVWGWLLGAVVGTGIASHLTTIVQGIERLMGRHFLSSQIYFVDFLPSEVQWQDSVTILLVTLSLSLLASWYPAYWSGKRDPVAIFR